MAKWWEAPEIGKKVVIANEKAWTNFLRHFPKADKSRFVSQAVLDEKQTRQQRCFSKKAKAHYKASSVRTENIGAWGWNKRSVWETAVVFLTSYRLLAQKFLYQSLQFLSRAKRQAWRKYSTPKSKYRSRLTNISQINSEKYFRCYSLLSSSSLSRFEPCSSWMAAIWASVFSILSLRTFTCFFSSSLCEESFSVCCSWISASLKLWRVSLQWDYHGLQLWSLELLAPELLIFCLWNFLENPCRHYWKFLSHHPLVQMKQ